MRRISGHVSWSVAICLMVWLADCGYKVQSSDKKLPSDIQSLGIPTFNNATSQYRIEQRITSAVLKEFSERTSIPAPPAASSASGPSTSHPGAG